MTWVTPATGLIIGAIAIPLLLLLYFLRLRRQPLRISSTMLWESAVEDLHANSPFQRLRPSLLLILQLLALLLFIFALMQPQIEGGSPRAGRHVILIDRSGSMSSFDVDDVSRLDEAKRQAIDLVNTHHGGGMFAGSGGETMVIAFADHAEIVIPFTDSQQQLKAAIQSIPPTHGRSSIAEALKLARAYTTNVDPEQEGLSASESAQLELFSDGQIFDIRKQALQRGETLRYYAIGSEESNNVGISTIAAKRPSESSEDVQVFLSLVNTGSEEVKTDVEISIDGIPIGIQQVVVPSSTDGKVGTISVVFVPFSMPRSGVVQATINSHDPLLIDDKVSLVIPPPKKLSVLVTEDGVSILRTVLEGMLLAELRQVDEGTLQKMITSGEASNYDVVVTRDVRLDELKQGRYLVFGAPPPVDAFANFVKGDGQVMLVAK
ncbi:MAG TPA: VWA domain-containing protein, partial [Phycisphaerales bacterium]|nr:VWA domain-containing protein [Phycisphaerales bacterium]